MKAYRLFLLYVTQSVFVWSQFFKGAAVEFEILSQSLIIWNCIQVFEINDNKNYQYEWHLWARKKLRVNKIKKLINEVNKYNYIFHLFFAKHSLVGRWTFTCDIWCHFVSFTFNLASVNTGSIVIQTIHFTI